MFVGDLSQQRVMSATACLTAGATYACCAVCCDQAQAIAHSIHVHTEYVATATGSDVDDTEFADYVHVDASSASIQVDSSHA